MGLIDRLRNKQKNASRVELSGFMAGLDTLGRYGLPPLSSYQRFNSVGAEFHGQCAVAQGATGLSSGVNFKIDLAKFLFLGLPFEMSVTPKVGGAYMATSAVTLFRLPMMLSTHSTGHRLPLALAQMDGPTIEVSTGVNAKLGSGSDMFKPLANYTIDVQAGADLKYLWTGLHSEDVHHFSDAAKRDLADQVDEMLAVEIKKACLNILAANKAWLQKDLPDILKDAAPKILEVGADVRKAIEKEENPPEDKEDGVQDKRGWKAILLGTLKSPGTYFAKKIGAYAWNALTQPSDENILIQLDELIDNFQLRHKRLQGLTGRDHAQERRDLEEALPRLRGFRKAFFDELQAKPGVFKNGVPPQAGPIPVIDPDALEAHILQPDRASLSLTSFNYGALAQANAKAFTIAAFDTSAHTEAGLQGRLVSFRFQMPAAGSYVFMQDTAVNFFQLSAQTAWEGSLLRTGIESIDKAYGDAAKLKKKKDWKDAGVGRFGAMTYRAAMVYADRDTRQVQPQISGIALGVSIRVARLCTYADAVRKLAQGGSLDDHTQAFETWTCAQLACRIDDLRAFVSEAPLGKEYIGGTTVKGKSGEDIPVGYPCDALLLETAFGFGMSAKQRAQGAKATNKDATNLFDYFKFSGSKVFKLADFRQQVMDDEWSMSVMRLRYRIQRPNTRNSKNMFDLGVPPEWLGKDAGTSGSGVPQFEASPLSISFNFNRETEVGQEGIVDLYAKFYGAFARGKHQKDDEKTDPVDDHTRYDLNVPPVVLFNRT